MNTHTHTHTYTCDVNYVKCFTLAQTTVNVISVSNIDRFELFQFLDIINSKMIITEHEQRPKISNIL